MSTKLDREFRQIGRIISQFNSRHPVVSMAAYHTYRIETNDNPNLTLLSQTIDTELWPEEIQGIWRNLPEGWNIYRILPCSGAQNLYGISPGELYGKDFLNK